MLRMRSSSIHFSGEEIRTPTRERVPTTVDLLVTIAGERSRAGDTSGALLADRLATGATRRLVLLLGAAEKRTAAVAIENAIVHVEATR